MKRIAMFILGVMVVSTSALAQAPDAAVETALLAAPANLREGAAVIKWKPDFTYDTLRKGTNRLVCYDRSGFPEQQPFSIECTSIANLDRVAQNLKFEAIGERSKHRRCSMLRKKTEPREARVRIGVVPHAGPRPGARSHTHDHRGAGRHDAVTRAARQQ